MTEVPNLTLLGRQVKGPVRKLEVIPLTHEAEVTMTIPSFTSRCPVTAQPDYASIQISFLGRATVETKSLKLYLESYRDEGVFGETFTNLLADDLWAALSPTWLKVETEWAPRGGISIRARTCRPVPLSTGAPATPVG